MERCLYTCNRFLCGILYASEYDDIQTVEDMPLAMAGFYLPGYGSVDPLVSFYVNARAGAMNTIYILGNWNISQVIRTKVVEDF